MKAGNEEAQVTCPLGFCKVLPCLSRPPSWEVNMSQRVVVSTEELLGTECLLQGEPV